MNGNWSNRAGVLLCLFLLQDGCAGGASRNEPTATSTTGNFQQDAAQHDTQWYRRAGHDVPPMITHPKAGAETCTTTDVRTATRENGILFGTFVLDGTILDVSRDRLAHFSLEGLSTGEHCLKFVLFDSDPHDSNAVILFQHWVVFTADQHACDTNNQSPSSFDDENHDASSVRQRHNFEARQLRLFMSAPSLLSSETIALPPRMASDGLGVLLPAWTVKPGRETGESFSRPRNKTINFGSMPPSEDLMELSSIVSGLKRWAARGATDAPFVFVDVGAAWGRQALRAMALARRFGAHVRTISVEAEPKHFELLQEVYRVNHLYGAGTDPREHRLEHAATGWEDGTSLFLVGDASFGAYGWWGQAMTDDESKPSVEVRVLTLRTLLEQEGVVDVMHLDIQDAEYKVLAAAAEDGTLDKVRALFIGTHSHHSHWGIVHLLCRLQWHSVVAIEPYLVGHSRYRYGDHTYEVGDGVQVWVNARLVDVEAEFGAQEPVGCEGISNTWTAVATPPPGQPPKAADRLGMLGADDHLVNAEKAWMYLLDLPGSAGSPLASLLQRHGFQSLAAGQLSCSLARWSAWCPPDASPEEHVPFFHWHGEAQATFLSEWLRGDAAAPSLLWHQQGLGAVMLPSDLLIAGRHLKYAVVMSHPLARALSAHVSAGDYSSWTQGRRPARHCRDRNLAVQFLAGAEACEETVLHHREAERSSSPNQVCECGDEALEEAKHRLTSIYLVLIHDWLHVSGPVLCQRLGWCSEDVQRELDQVQEATNCGGAVTLEAEGYGEFANRFNEANSLDLDLYEHARDVARHQLLLAGVPARLLLESRKVPVACKTERSK